jgi:copper chaperone
MITGMTSTIEQLSYSVPGISCAHCRAAVSAEVRKVTGVHDVDVDLDNKRVTVTGDGLDDASIRDAIDDAGYEIA